MKITDAASILGLSGEITPETVKAAYRKAAKTYHPDINPAGAEMMKVVNAAFEQLKDYSGTVGAQTTEPDYPDALNAALSAIIDLMGLDIEICGAWVWVTGETFGHKDALKAAGFKFAGKKKAWYFRPENWKSKSRGDTSLDEIRDLYGSDRPARPTRDRLAGAAA